MGLLAIQVASKVHGLKVVTTAGVKHHEMLRSIGAELVVDYHDEDTVEKVKESGEIPYAVDTVGSKTTCQQTYDAVDSGAVVDNVMLLEPSAINEDVLKQVAFKRHLGSFGGCRLYLINRKSDTHQCEPSGRLFGFLE